MYFIDKDKKSGFTTVMVWNSFYIYHLKSCVHRICKEPLIQILSLSLIIIAQFDDCRCVLSLCLCVIYVCFTYAMLKTLKIFIFENL